MIQLGDYRETLDHVRPDLILTSPQYNLGNGKRKRNDLRRGRTAGNPRDGRDHRIYTGPTYDDDLPEAVYQDQQAEFLVWCADHLAPGGTLVYSHKPRQRNKTLIDPHEWILRPEVKARIVECSYPVVWDRGSTHAMSAFTLWQKSERLYVMRRVEDQKLWHMDNLGQDFPYDIWRIPHDARLVKKYGHCAPFPLALAEAVVQHWSKPGDLVCDPFAGSGTTGVAAIKAGRMFEGAEVVETYYQAALARLSTMTPEDAAA